MVAEPLQGFTVSASQVNSLERQQQSSFSLPLSSVVSSKRSDPTWLRASGLSQAVQCHRPLTWQSRRNAPTWSNCKWKEAELKSTSQSVSNGFNLLLFFLGVKHFKSVSLLPNTSTSLSSFTEQWGWWWSPCWATCRWSERCQSSSSRSRWVVFKTTALLTPASP